MTIIEKSIIKENIALLLIDIQKGFNDSYWGIRNNPNAEENIIKLIESFRSKNKPIFHIQHISTEIKSPLRPNQPGIEFMECAKPKPNEPVFQKQVNSAFIGTTLEIELHKLKIKYLVIAGISTDHCVSTTVRMAANLGFNNYVAADATIAFNRIGHDGKEYAAEIIHDIALASLHNEFAVVSKTENILNLLD